MVAISKLLNQILNSHLKIISIIIIFLLLSPVISIIISRITLAPPGNIIELTESIRTPRDSKKIKTSFH